jgi:acetyl-CoA carboxylase biotin carboxyl carrier protein
VASESTGSPRPFDVKTVEYLIGLMAQHELAEISLSEGEQRIRLRKAVAPPVVMAAAPMPVATPAAPVAAAVPAAAPAAAAAPAKSNLREITSEMVGTFYAKPSPDKPPYISVGSVVGPETIVCQIEAMKIYNQMPAGVSGKIAEVCVKDGEAVDFGRVLFRVEPS